jgi:ComF family protein
MSILSKLTSFAQSVPGTCQICARWPALPICTACSARFGQPRPRCETCARPLHGLHSRCGACLSEKRPSALDTCLAAVDYAYPWDQLIARFKFRQEPALAQPFAALMLRNPQLSGLLQRCDWIAPIPVAPARLAERGYNQAWELVKALRRLSGQDCPPGWANALQRQGQAPDQHNLPAQQRANNLEGAFHVEVLNSRRLHSTHVLLIDDVSTTGATLRAAAQALRSAGACRVSAAVFAHTAGE